MPGTVAAALGEADGEERDVADGGVLPPVAGPVGVAVAGDAVDSLPLPLPLPLSSAAALAARRLAKAAAPVPPAVKRPAQLPGAQWARRS